MGDAMLDPWIKLNTLHVAEQTRLIIKACMLKLLLQQLEFLNSFSIQWERLKIDKQI